MVVYRVPAEYDTLDEAIAAATVSEAENNAIWIGESPIVTESAVTLGAAFHAGRQLAIRPSPELGLRRVVIANNDRNGEPIFVADGTGYVTFQDLDIVRTITNRNDLVVLFGCDNMIIERCRIGSIFLGSLGWSNLRITRPTNIVVRNSIFFAYCSGTFDYAIWAELATAMENSLLLYNNVAADYRLNGIYVTGGGDAFLLLRNNVAVNHSDVDPEPCAYWSSVNNLATVVASHNAALASVGQAEEIAVGCQSIAGVEGFLRRARARVDAAFVQHTWVIYPERDPNVDFFRLVRGGPLHSEPADTGTNVSDHDPHDRDVAVADDIEQDPRPAGIPLHTDRGADQILQDDTFLDLKSFGLAPAVVAGCKGCIGKITLNGIAPEGGWKVKIASVNPAATVPASVKIPAGVASQTFQIATMPVKTVKVGKVIATCRGVTRSRSLTVRPIGVDSLNLSSTTVIGSKNVIGTVVLECEAAPVGIKVTLKSSSAAAVVPISFTIVKGALSRTFRIKTKPVSAVKSVSITATANGISKSVTLKIKPG